MNPWIVLGVVLILGMAGAIAGGLILRAKIEGLIRRKNKDIEQYRHFYQFFHQLYLLEQKNRNISMFFVENDIRYVAIYGYAVVGQILEQELEAGGISVSYIIDAKMGAGLSSGGKPIYAPAAKLPETSMVVVTTVDFSEVRRELDGNVSCPVVHILDIIETVGEGLR